MPHLFFFRFIAHLRADLAAAEAAAAAAPPQASSSSSAAAVGPFASPLAAKAHAGKLRRSVLDFKQELAELMGAGRGGAAGQICLEPEAKRQRSDS